MDVCLFHRTEQQRRNKEQGTISGCYAPLICFFFVFFLLQLTIIDENCYYSQSNLTSVIRISTIMENFFF